MKNSKLSRSALSLILAMLLMFSLFTVGVFAEENVTLIAPNPNAGETVTIESGEAGATTDAANNPAEAPEGPADPEVTPDTSKEEPNTPEGTTEGVGPAADTTGSVDQSGGDSDDGDHAGHDHGTEGENGTNNEKGNEDNTGAGFDTYDLVSLIIIGVLLILGLIYCLKNREKVGKFLRGLKSEFKKISWSSWKDVRKSTLVVLVVVIVVALIVMGVDWLFQTAVALLA